jgi:hypothetical protein
MTPDDYYNQIVPDYFLDEQHDVLKPLPQNEYSYLIGLIEQAIDEYPDDCAFWFWKGWALQFYSGDHEGLPRHPHFELIEDAYERVLKLDSDRIEAHFMLAYLYWDSYRRFKAHQPEGVSASNGPNLDQDSRSIDAAREQWSSFQIDGKCYDLMSNERFRLYPFEVQVWSVLLRKMLADVNDDSRLLPSLCFEWAQGWLSSAREQEAKQDYERGREAYEQARQAFAIGANAKTGDPGSAEHVDCQIGLARLYSRRYGGDPVKGLTEWRRFADLAVEARQEWDGNEFTAYSVYSVKDFVDFLYENQSLIDRAETLDVILHLESTGWFDLSSQGNGKLQWFTGRCYINKREWGKADDYLSLAHREMSESDLILDLATAKDEQGKSDESVRLLRTLPGQTQRDLLIRRLAERDLVRSEAFRSVERLPASIDRLEGKIDTVYGLVNNLGETVTTALQNLQMPQISPSGQDDQDVDEIASRVAAAVSAQFSEIIGRQTALLNEIQRKCQSDLDRIWPLLPPHVQEQLVVAETMSVLFSEYSLPEYGMPIVQWGKSTEALLTASFLAPMLNYLDRIDHTSPFVIVKPPFGDKSFTDDFGPPYKGKKWIDRLNALNFGRSLGLLFAIQQLRDEHVVYGFLKEMKIESGRIDAWLRQVPIHLDAIRRLRNEAAHGHKRIERSNALDVRDILFTRGLIAEMAFLLERAASAGLAPK